MKLRFVLATSLLLLGLLVVPELAHATVESSMVTLQEKILGTFLPLLSVLALLFAGLSYLPGSPNARSYLGAAIVGAVVGFGAESFVNLIRAIVH
jgi:type IV secretory pathway VirB2 component (pilin)